MQRWLMVSVASAAVWVGVVSQNVLADADTLACAKMLKGGLLKVPDDRADRFNGKVSEDTARCRGGEKAVQYRFTPWVDWSNYWAVGDASTLHDGPQARTLLGEHLKPNGRGIDGALLDLEYQRIELIKFNLFDNYTYKTYVTGKAGQTGRLVKSWDEMRLSKIHPQYAAVGGADKQQLCRGELIRARTLSGICNDIYNPMMGSAGMDFARNVQFEATFPDQALTALTKARHGGRIDAMTPDPQLISRQLFTRMASAQSTSCHQGKGLADHSASADCPYAAAPFFNVLAAYWIQFMTHDWFTHMKEGRNQPGLLPTGCASSQAELSGCRTGDRMEAALTNQQGAPSTFRHEGQEYWARSPKTFKNFNTAWWDGSQIYGFDETSAQRVLRDPVDKARLLQPKGYLPVMSACATGQVSTQSVPCVPSQPQWTGQEAAAFPDNWSIGMSFYHNLFVREHNNFVTNFRAHQKQHPNEDSGLRTPDAAAQPIPYAAVSDEELFNVARLVVSAEIAKIHTIEWTTQLLYGEPLYKGMNSNWFGLFDAKDESPSSRALKKIIGQDESVFARTSDQITGAFGRSDKSDANSWYSIFASGAGIFGLGNKIETGKLWWKKDVWSLENPEHVNRGVNHFGSPFNFPEEFVTVYRLHPLLPDLIEYRDSKQPNQLAKKIPVVDTVRGLATTQMREHGLASWGVSMGRQRLSLLQLQNHPQFLQNLDMPHLNSATRKIDVAALDLIRDRERGIPRFNEFRRQIGLKTLTSFDDFVDQRLPKDSPTRQAQEKVIAKMREIYGTHTCDASKIISVVQKDAQGNFINDCLGHEDGSVVDNIEDVDTLVGWLAEYTRPHGFAISETQFHVFIINASRRLFSDRFFTSSFRPEFYSHLGVSWVNNNGPLAGCPFPLETTATGQSICMEPEWVNGHKVAVSPMKRLLMRNIPELKDELLPVKNAFDPWARDRGEYYSLAWKPRAGAEQDPAFKP
jgi:hypothetical protein